MDNKLNTEEKATAKPMLYDVLDFTDSNGKELRLGDKVRGEGFITFQDGFKIDRTPIVTIRFKNGFYYFGGLSKQSFNRFHKVDE